MQVQIFKGAGRVFCVVEQGGGQALPGQYGPWTEFKSLEMQPGQPQPGVEVDECLDDIARYGFHLTDAHVRITDKALGSAATG